MEHIFLFKAGRWSYSNQCIGRRELREVGWFSEMFSVWNQSKTGGGDMDKTMLGQKATIGTITFYVSN